MIMKRKDPELEGKIYLRKRVFAFDEERARFLKEQREFREKLTKVLELFGD